MQDHYPVKEAVRYLSDPLLSKEYRRQCLALWRREYGDSWTDTVQKELMIIWNKRKK